MTIQQVAARICVIATFAAASSGAWAFADDEARTAILDLREQVKTLQAAQLNFVSRIEELQNQNRMLTGRVEELSNQILQEGRSTRDLFKDLDQRLGKLEPLAVVINGETVEVMPQEKAAYDEAVNALQGGDYKKAEMLFEHFAEDWNRSAYRPDALFWLGSSQYANEKYKSAYNTQNKLIKSYPKHVRVPDAMLSVASSQAALGNLKAAGNTLRKIQRQFPKTEASKEAAARLKTLR